MKHLLLLMMMSLTSVAWSQELRSDAEEKRDFFKSQEIPIGNKLLIFMSIECPLCKNYTTILKELSKKYGEKIKLNFVFSGKGYDQVMVDDFLKEYDLAGYKILDTAFFLSRAYHASVTPEVILLDTENNMLYQGAIDNWLAELGKKRVIVTAHYLNDAIQQFLAGKPILVSKTEAKGCLLNDY